MCRRALQEGVGTGDDAGTRHLHTLLDGVDDIKAVN
jgi:hypothetical protein